MASQGVLMNFPIRTRDKGTSWASKHDDPFQGCPDGGLLENINSWDDSIHPTSSFDELFEDLLDSASRRTHSSGTSEIKLLTEPHPAFLDADDFWTSALTSLEDTKSQTLQSAEPLLPASKSIPATYRHFDHFGFPSPPYAPASPVFVEEVRGRTKTGAQQGSIRRSRNPSGVRKSLRHTKSTPNMMNQSRYRPSFGEMLSQAQTNTPPVPVIGKKWNMRHPPSPPTSTETNDSFVPPQGLGFDVADRQIFSQSQDFVDPFLVPSGAAHSPFLSPLEDNYFGEPMGDGWVSSYNDEAITFNTNNLHGNLQRSTYDRRRSLTDFDIPTPPSFNPWTKANATPPPPLTLNAAALRSIPPQAVMSAPLLKPQLGLGFPTNYTTNTIMSSQTPLMTDGNVSPRTNTFPSTVPNFSLPYRSGRSVSPQRETQPQPIRPSHHRATSELPTQQGEDLTTRRMRSASRGATGKHHRRTKSGPGPSNEPSSGPRASRRKEGKAGQLVGFVNFTPDDSKKLLTGVAPSGSSKTKARREKEAMEKRRRLSQAAVKAVREGDLGALREAGLVMEDA
ncbi:hypothetical protein KVT40_007991 [Elsinoe batatas]|uniref:Developmental regulatory protein wetA n=1 Tax=Elsinoe batatas TaxID=2601811 RepID=A0A8K0KTI4_9PEZI|nr:hypothetical protein KVT40_007991 [Elsinoe batatas]